MFTNFSPVYRLCAPVSGTLCLLLFSSVNCVELLSFRDFSSFHICRLTNVSAFYAPPACRLCIGLHSVVFLPVGFRNAVCLSIRRLCMFCAVFMYVFVDVLGRSLPRETWSRRNSVLWRSFMCVRKYLTHRRNAWPSHNVLRCATFQVLENIAERITNQLHRMVLQINKKNYAMKLKGKWPSSICVQISC